MADDTNREDGASSSPAEKARALATDAIIDRFGGVRPMAGKLGVPAETVQDWRKRGFIPEDQAADMAAVAATHGISLDRTEIDAATAPASQIGEADRQRLAALEREVAEKARRDAAEPPTPEPTPAPKPTPASTPKPASTTTTKPASTKPTAGPTTSPPLIPPPQPRRGGGLMSGTALLIAILALGVAGYGQWTAMQNRTPPALPDLEPLRTELAQQRAENDSNRDALAALTARVQALESRPVPQPETTEIVGPAPQEDAPQQPGDPAVDLEPLRRQQAELAARLDQLEQQARMAEPAVDADALTSRLDNLEQRAETVTTLADGQLTLRQQTQALAERVAALEARRQQASAGEGLVVAVGQLQAALTAGRPYEREYRAVAALTGDQPALRAALAPLEATAEAGLPSDVALMRQFRELAPAILRAERTRADASWTEQALGRLSSVITIRRASGEVAGLGADAVLARAEAALIDGEIDKAVAEMENLEGPAAAVAAPWLAGARARVAAETAGNQLAELALKRLSGDGEPTP